MDADHVSEPAWHSWARWRRRIVLWLGAVAVALAAIVFAKGADAASSLFSRAIAPLRWLPFVVTPAGFAMLAWLTTGVLRATRGSGIPQVIAVLQREDDAVFRTRMLALPVAAGKLVLTLFAMLIGASVGREGPSVHVGAGIMTALAQRFGFRDATSLSRFALAGGAAGIAAAFNTPLAGVVFAIEELAGTFEHRFSGVLLTAVMIGGVVSLGLMGNYAYFGRPHVELPLGGAWVAVLATGLIGGLAGGAFARVILLTTTRIPGPAGALRARHPIVFAALCGLVLAAIGYASGDSVYGTGYAQARALLSADGAVTHWFGLDKWLANVVSYLAGIPGGIFSPALAVGAGIGANLAPWLPHASVGAVVLLGMASYLAGVTQAPLTAAVICMELVDGHDVVLPIMAACLLGRTFASLVCPQPVYGALAQALLRSRAEEASRKETTP